MHKGAYIIVLIVCAILLASLVFFVAKALGATASPGLPPELKRWQAIKVARANAELTNREAYRVRYTVRLSRTKIKVCWRDAPYLEGPGEHDIGCDWVELRRGREFWLFDDSILGLVPRRWL
jgi:hypothetical protein